MNQIFAIIVNFLALVRLIQANYYGGYDDGSDYSVVAIPFSAYDDGDFRSGSLYQPDDYYDYPDYNPPPARRPRIRPMWYDDVEDIDVEIPSAGKPQFHVKPIPLPPMRNPKMSPRAAAKPRNMIPAHIQRVAPPPHLHLDPHIHVAAPHTMEKIRLVAPPSPITSQCPVGYLCCGNMKHPDPHGRLSCCGSQAYIPKEQYCTQEDQVVDLVSATRAPSHAPPPVYVQKVTLLCEGIRWEVPYPNYQCCGPSVYNVAKEVCSSGGLIEPRTAPPPSTTTTTQVPTRILVCRGHKFTIPAYDYQFYACCSSDPYFWPRESCINGAVSPARPSTTTTSATPQEVQVLLLCDGRQHWIPSTDRLYYGCCGKDVYDLRTDVCRPELIASESKLACPAKYICCGDYPPVKNSAELLKCCPGIGPYDPKVGSCPTGI